MNSQLDRCEIPQQEEYFVTIHHQPIHLNCQSRIDSECAPPKGNVIHLDDDVTIENYYCYEGIDELVKITKIRAGNQTVTLTDRITVYNSSGKDEKKDQKQFMVAQSSNTTQTDTHTKSDLTLQILKKFKSWILTNQPKLLPTLKKVKQNSSSEAQLKQNINCQAELRQAFFRFRHSVNSSKTGKKIKGVVDQWHKSFLPAHKRHLKNEAYLNKILENAIQANE